MARIRSFNEEEVVQKAQSVFWLKGYEATSVADLVESTGLNRGSLYNTFGGKRELFLRTLLQYDQQVRRKTLADLEALDDPLKAFENFFNDLLEETIEDEDRKGCFLINTSLDFQGHDPKIQELLKQGMKEMEAFFRRGIEVSQARNLVEKNLDAASIAKSLLGSVVAIRVLGRGVFDKHWLQHLVEEALGRIR